MTGPRLRLAGPEDADRLDRALAQLSAALGDTHRADADLLTAAGWGPHPVFRAILAEAGRMGLTLAELVAALGDRRDERRGTP